MYGRPRSKNYNWQHFKKILAQNNLPNIRWHDLRGTYATLLLKNDFSLKAVSKLLGHSKEIITADVYGDTQEIIADCLEELEPFIASVDPANETIDINDYSDTIYELEGIVDGFIPIMETVKVKDYTEDFTVDYLDEELLSKTA